MDAVAGLTIPEDNDPLVFDPACDPLNPVVVNYNLIEEAQERIRAAFTPSRCDLSRLSLEFGMKLYLKRDYENITYSFKERGACNVLLSLTKAQREKGVITASSGNHGSAMACYAQKFGIPCTVCMPSLAPLPKIQNCRRFGANLVLKGKNVADSRKLALKIANTQGLVYINGYDHPQILAGQGVAGLEILDQVPDVDAIIIPIGGGGLISGVARVVKTKRPQIKIYGVESVRCASWQNAMAEGKPIFTPCDHTLADGLLVPTVGSNSFATSASLIDKCVVVNESFICRAILKMIEVEKAVVEGAGATALAAIMAGLFPELINKKVVCFMSGGNIDPFVLSHVIERGLTLENRLIRISVYCNDNPGGLAELTAFVAKQGVNIRKIDQDKIGMKDDIYVSCVHLECESQDEVHANQFMNKLKEHYPTAERLY